MIAQRLAIDSDSSVNPAAGCGRDGRAPTSSLADLRPFINASQISSVAQSAS
jgi:hypothetical protein